MPVLQPDLLDIRLISRVKLRRKMLPASIMKITSMMKSIMKTVSMKANMKMVNMRAVNMTKMPNIQRNQK